MPATQQYILTKLRHLKPGLIERYGITKLALFGSVARGTASAESDIDVVVELKNPSLFALVHIKDELEVGLSQKVDIIHYNKRLNPFLKARIQTEALDV